VNPSPATEAPAPRSLVSLLGEQRAAIIEELRRRGERSVAELAVHLGISEVATRRHLSVLEDERLVASTTVKQARGRPAARYHLTEAASQLFPHRYDRFANEVLDFLADAHGRDGLRAFLRWRLEREVSGLREAVTAEALHERLEQLAGALSNAGFQASVTPDGGGFTLTQDHCAIYDVAKDHPEVCAYEAATFSEVLGGDVTLSRRETLAGGAPACVCCVAPRSPAEPPEVRGVPS
jgi:predicted ArsR family transcriptional regulator